jgi:fructose/tagatose bisphosphate aldolase
VKTTLANTDEIDLRKTFAPAINAVQEVAAAKIKVCQADG